MLLQLPAAVDVNTLQRLRTAPPGGYEFYEDVLFDTVTYPTGGASRLTVFTQTTQDATVTNVQPPGQLPAPHWFRCHRLFCDFLTEAIRTDAATDAGPLDDVTKILNTARAMLTFVSGATQRRRAAIPLAALGSMGGIAAEFGGGAVGLVQHARTLPNGGFPFDQIIQFGETFGFELTFAPAGGGGLVTVSKDVPIRLAMYGWRYVPVTAGR